jgi:hypothetical protein
MDRSSPIISPSARPNAESSEFAAFEQPSPENARQCANAAAASDLRRHGNTIRLGFDASEALDNRRIRQRETIDTLLMRCEHLPAIEATLLRSVYADKRTIRELAALQKRDERSLMRQVRRIVRRVLSPEFAIVLTQGPTWTQQRSRIAQAMFVQGLGLRRTAAAMRVSVYCVRLHVAAVRELAAAARRARKIAAQQTHIGGEQ